MEGSGEIQTVNPVKLKYFIVLSYFSRIPLFIWGPPGVGKSQIVRQTAMEIARILGLRFSDLPEDFKGSSDTFVLIDLRPAYLEPSDLLGIPDLDREKKVTIWCVPEWLPREGKGIIFLDELNLAVPAVQHACYQLILDRRLGAYLLPEGWVVIAAGNREIDRAGVHPLPPPLANRFIHVELVNDIESWRRWAQGERASLSLPSAPQGDGSGIREEIIAFLTFRPEFLYKSDASSKAFPTPRSWEMLSRLMNIWDDLPNPITLQELAGATVGPAVAHELISFLRLRKEVPNPGLYLDDPDLPLPSELSQLHALVSAISSLVHLDPTQEKVDGALRFSLRLEKEGFSEPAIMLVKLLGGKCKPQILSSKYWPELAAKWRKYLNWREK